MGLKQKEIGEQLEITMGGYSNYERHYSFPSIEKLVKLAEILHTSVQYIVTGEALSGEFEQGAIPFSSRCNSLEYHGNNLSAL